MPEHQGGWFFQNVPAPWQWVSLIGGLLGLVLAVIASQNILQSFCGVAKLTISTRRTFYSDYSGKRLELLIHNHPITNPILRALRVERRDEPTVHAKLWISDSSGKQVVAPEIPFLLYSGGQPFTQHRSVPVGDTPVFFIIAHRKKLGPAWVELNPNHHGSSNVIWLEPGRYVANVSVSQSNGRTIEHVATFIVGNKDGSLYVSGDNED